jgi:hypothetical protein
MAARNQPVLPVLLACAIGAASGWLPRTAAAQARTDAVAAAGTATSPVTGSLPAGTAADMATEPVVFAGQAAVSGRVVRDTTFGAPPVLELVIDLGKVTARGLRSGVAYHVHGEAILHRPLQAFEQVEVGVSIAPPNNPLQARSAVATFGVHYSAAKGITATPVSIAPHPPS